MKSRLLAMLLLPLFGYSAAAQTVSLFNIDPSGFPTVSANFYAFDGTGTQTTPSQAELSLTEEGTPRTILSVSCPPQVAPRALSSVLVIDVSGSMATAINGTPNINLAKAAANSWINALPLGQSECAVTSFDHLNYLNQDFTTDKASLATAINLLTPQGATNYDMGLLLPLAGGLQVTKRGTHQRVIVFLTDGLPSTEPDVEAIVAEATAQNCIIYAVTLNMTCPASLKEISQRTGGDWSENITSIAQAESVYRRILFQAQDRKPCTVTWQAIPCRPLLRNVELGWMAATDKGTYSVGIDQVAALRFAPTSLFFRSKTLLTQHDTTITVTAQNQDFTVSDVVSSNPAYQINPKSFLLKAGESKVLTVSYTPTDSGYNWTTFDFQTNACSEEYFASGGFPGVPPSGPSLKVDHPNGGEIFVVGRDTVIRWSGIPKTDPVLIEYSIDNGTGWTEIASGVTGGEYAWHIPKTPSNLCLVRVTRVDDSKPADPSGLLHILSGHPAPVSFARWSPDGSLIATGGLFDAVKIWNSYTGTLISTLSGNVGGVSDIKWSPDGTLVATGGVDGSLRIWDPGTGSQLRVLVGHTARVRKVNWSPDGKKLASASQDGVAKIWDAGTGALLYTLTGHTQPLGDVEWNPTGDRLLTASLDETIKLWNPQTGALIRTMVLPAGTGSITVYPQTLWSPDGSWFVAVGGKSISAVIFNPATGAEIRRLNGHPDLVVGIAMSNDGKYIGTSGFDQTVRIWQSSTGNLMHTFSTPSGIAPEMGFSPDGSLFAAGDGLNATSSTEYVWETVSGKEVRRFEGHTGLILSSAWNPIASPPILATASYDGTARIWGFPQTIELVDVSDAVFSIVEPKVDIIDVDLGKVLVGTVKDSVVTAFITNPNPYAAPVDTIRFSGASASRFAVVSGLPPLEIPGNSAAPVEFRFAPTTVGVKSAQLIVETPSGIEIHSIRGEGIAPELVLVDNVIDFGQVLVGTSKDTMKSTTIANIGSAPITINATRHAGPNDIDFTTLAGGGTFTLMPGDTAKVDLRFLPTEVGRTSGRLLFEYNGPGSPATVQLFGEGVKAAEGTLALVQNAIDFGQVEVGKWKDTIDAVSVFNNGSIPVTIIDVLPNGPNLTDFTLLKGDGPIILLPGETAKLDVRFTPSAIGPTQGSLLYSYNNGTGALTVDLLGEGVKAAEGTLALVQNAIDFGQVEVGKWKDTIDALSVYNNGPIPVTIIDVLPNGPNLTDFTLLKGNGPIILLPGETAKLDVRFTPSAIGPTQGSLLYSYNNGTAALTVDLLGEGIAAPFSASATLATEDYVGTPGEVIDIPIKLKNSTNVELSGATRFATRLRFNATLLEPIGGTPQGSIDGDDRVIDLDLPTVPDADGSLGTYSFRVGLGSDSTTTLLLEDPQAVDGTVAVSVEVGTFHLLGICYAGGPRLINPNGSVALRTAGSNMTTDGRAEIEMETVEIGRTTLQLFDLAGRPVRTYVDGEIAPGRHLLQIDVDALPTGLYFLVLQTPTERLHVPVEVVR